MTQDDLSQSERSDVRGQADMDALAARVILELCDRKTQTATGARQYVLDYLLRACLRRGGFHGPSVLTELLGLRLTRDEVIDTYIPLVARELGEMWMRSNTGFAEVTIGTLRLQSLLGEVSSETFGVPARSAAPQLDALIVVPEGEQHFLGAHVLAAQLRRRGINTSLSFAETPEVVSARAEIERPDMVLITCARVEGLASATQVVKSLRQSGPPEPLIALGGAMRGDTVGIRKKTGVDIVTNNASEVISFCAKRKQALSKD